MKTALALLLAAGAAAHGHRAGNDRTRLISRLREAAKDASSPQEAMAHLKAFGAKAAARKYDALQQSIVAGATGNVSVVTPFGVVTGIAGAGNGSNAFLGIPYAVPPVGPLRWKPPQALGMLPSSPYNAMQYGHVCPQGEWIWAIGSPGFSEDCLYLNIYTPSAPAPAGGYPVMLFLHGGSWVFGSGSFLLYDGTADEDLVQDVIIVTINYRLGALGFLAGQPLLDESTDGSVGNYGFQDQRAALQFVRSIIGSFGGDANTVMLFGESAGAGSTTNHLVSPRSQGLFQRAAMESGSFTPWAAQPLNISMSRFAPISTNVGCAGAGTNAQILACMRALNYSALLNGDKNNVPQGVIEWSPTIDGVELVGDPRDLLAAGALPLQRAAARRMPFSLCMLFLSISLTFHVRLSLTHSCRQDRARARADGLQQGRGHAVQQRRLRHQRHAAARRHRLLHRRRPRPDRGGPVPGGPVPHALVGADADADGLLHGLPRHGRRQADGGPGHGRLRLLLHARAGAGGGHHRRLQAAGLLPRE